MELLKAREKPEILTSLESLNKRMTLTSTDKQYLFTLSKGYEGEGLFDSIMKKHLDADALVLTDLSLISGSSPFQIDSILLTSDTIYLYEVKNYEGSYTNRVEQFHTSAGQKILSPENQINRTATLLAKMFNKWTIPLPVKSAVIFVNPAFILYEAKKSDPFVFPSQIEAHFSDVSRWAGSLSTKHHYLAQKLIEESQKELPYQRQLPLYDFAGLKKGLSCSRCGSFNLKNTTKSSRCQTCGTLTSINALFLSHVNAFNKLFPDKLITRNTMYEWCGGMLSKRRITAILNANYEKKGYAKSSHYL